MNKNLIVISLFLFSFVSFNPIGKIYTNEPISNGDEFNLYVNLGNALDQQVEEISVKAFIYDLGEMITSNNLDIGKKSTKLSRIFWTLQDVPSGEYLVKVSASNDKFRNSRHIIVEVR